MGSQNTVSLTDIASAAGVSRIAAAKVLTGAGGRTTRVGKETAKHIQVIANRLDYRPNLIAQQLAGKRSKIIGVILDSQASIYHIKLVSHMEQIASKAGYRFMIGQSHENLEKVKEYAHDFASRRVDGIICVSHDYPHIGSEVCDVFSQIKSHVVFIGKPAHRIDGLNLARCNIAMGQMLIVKHLFDRQCKRIAALLYASGSQSMTERLKGYLAAHRERNISANENLIRYLPAQEKITVSILKDEILHLIKEDKVDAIISPDDIVAAMVVMILKENGCRVPEDVAVACFNNTTLSEFCDPPLTAVDQQKERLAKVAVELLLKLIRGENVSQKERHIVVDPKLIIRRSS